MTTTADPKVVLFSLLHPIFADCCDPEPTRFDLSTPYLQGEHVYATNGSIAVRCPVTLTLFSACGAVPCREGSRRVKGVVEVFGGSIFRTEPFALPAESEVPKCAECKGTGRLGPGPCTVCRGCGLGDRDPDRIGHPIGDGVGIVYRVLAPLYKHNALVFPNAMFTPKEPFRFTVGDGGIEGRFMLTSTSHVG